MTKPIADMSLIELAKEVVALSEQSNQQNKTDFQRGQFRIQMGFIAAELSRRILAAAKGEVGEVVKELEAAADATCVREDDEALRKAADLLVATAARATELEVAFNKVSELCQGAESARVTLLADRDALAARVRELEGELERERMRLVACSTVARSNTPDSAREAREMHPDYKSAACDDVATAVDREMRLRADRDRLVAELEVAQRDIEIAKKIATLLNSRRNESRREYVITDLDLVMLSDGISTMLANTGAIREAAEAAKAKEASDGR